MLTKSRLPKKATKPSKTSRKRTNGAAKTEVMTIQLPTIKRLSLTLVGISSLITHRYSEKAKKMVRDKQQKKAKAPRAAKDPIEEFQASKYVVTPKRGKRKEVCGIPAAAIKATAIRGCKLIGLVMKDSQGAFFVNGDILPLKYDECVMREDRVVIGQGTLDMRYRPEFKNWSVKVEIEYNSNCISHEEIISAYAAAGFGVGVGEWRPERKGGNFGRFKVDNNSIQVEVLG